MNITNFNNKKNHFNIKTSDKDFVIALAGNPNTGKSTIFNNLTGLRQHTGNWPGKTVTNAQGYYDHGGKSFIVVDLPGTYSLLANSTDEIVARDFICFGKPDVTIVVADATNLERNLNLALQIMEATNTVVLCINLLDEAEKMGITINIDKLSKELGIPVVGTVARNKIGLTKLKEITFNIATRKLKPAPYKIIYSVELEKLISEIALKLIKLLDDELDARWVAIRLIEGDKTIIKSIEKYLLNKHTKLESDVASCLK
ncbi:MAG: FeoB small GTPase domain-containing protein [Vulcanibacillus sp.]